MQTWTGMGIDSTLPNACKERTMHDLLIALEFVGMVIAPALVAARSGSGEPDEIE